MEKKICNCCGGEFPATREYFSPNKLGRHGLMPKCKPCRNKLNKEAYPERTREYNYIWKYGLTLEEYNSLLDSQDGVCAVCGGPNKRAMVIDHDHETGEIRGLLCDSCNRGLGFFSDDPDLLSKASEYLRG